MQIKINANVNYKSDKISLEAKAKGGTAMVSSEALGNREEKNLQ